MANLWDDNSGVVGDFGLMDQANITFSAHTNNVDPHDLSMAQMNIEQIVQQVMASNPGISGQDLLGEVEKNFPNANIPRDMVAQFVEQAELKNRDLEDHMNMTPDGNQLSTQEIGAAGFGLTALSTLGYSSSQALASDPSPEQGQENNPFAAIMAMFQPIMDFFASMQNEMNIASEQQGQDVSLAQLGNLSPPTIGVQPRSISQGLSA